MNLHDYPKFGSGPCLERGSWLLAELGLDGEWLSASSIAVTGSNGKGSTAASLASIGRHHGLRTGLFISPHLYDVRERIRIDGEFAGKDVWDELEEKVSGACKKFERANPGERFGVFEILFTMAVEWFYRERCDLCVLEAGIGGRLDPVRLAGAHRAVVASLDLEHTELLGGTLEEICFDKTDICAAPGSVFYGGNCLALRPQIEDYCELRGLSARFCGPGFDGEPAAGESAFEILRQTGKGSVFRFREQDAPELKINLLGSHQVQNAALAVQVFREWAEEEGKARFSWTDTAQGLLQVSWPGRLETIRENPLTVADVGHSPAAISAGILGLQEAFPDRQWILVTGVSKNKKIREIVELLLPNFEIVVCTRAYHRGAAAGEIADIVREAAPGKRVFEAGTIEQAVSLANNLAAECSSGIYVAGGLFLAIEFTYALRGGDPRKLQFL